MRISDWSSDVCSSDLPCLQVRRRLHTDRQAQRRRGRDEEGPGLPQPDHAAARSAPGRQIRKRPRRDCSRSRSERKGKFMISLLLIRSEEHTSELQSLMRISYAVFCLKKKQKQQKVEI